MTLIKCKECGTAKVCMNCSAKTELTKMQKSNNLKILLFIITIAIIVIAYILVVCFKETDAEKQMRETKDFRKSIKNSYDTMLENNK